MLPRPTPRKPDNPVFWIVGGPNGSGKSSLDDRTDIEGWGGSVWIINPDLLTAKIVEQESLALANANLAAVQRIERWLEASVESYQTVGVETVLSSRKYRRLVMMARERGFRVRMVFVLLRSVDMQLARIRQRVSDGGHDVPEDKVRARRKRSFEEFAWFADNVDDCYVFDNSLREPQLVAARASQGPLWQFEPMPSDFLDAIRAGPVGKHLRSNSV